jgi:hypothetical protein
MKDEIFDLPLVCKELKGSHLLREWVATLSPNSRAAVLDRVSGFLEGDFTRIFILKNGILEIRINEPANIFVYLYFDVTTGKFDFMKGIALPE